MEFDSEIDWGLTISVIASMGSLCVSFINLWLLRKERIRFYREKIYETQLKAYKDILQDFEKVIADSIVVAVSNNKTNDKSGYAEVNSFQKLSFVNNMNLVFLSEEMYKFAQKFQLDVIRILLNENLSMEMKISNLSDLLLKAIELTRKDMNVGVLSSETTHLIKKLTSEIYKNKLNSDGT